MSRSRAFTLLEVALIVAIIGMMLLMIVGYLFAPKDKGPLPPIAATTPIPSMPSVVTPAPAPAPAPVSSATPVPAPAPATPLPSATPAQSIDLSPQTSPNFR